MKFKEQEITSQNEYQLEFKKFVEKFLILKNNNQDFDLNHYPYIKRTMQFWGNASLGKSVKKQMMLFDKYFSLEKEKITIIDNNLTDILLEVYLFLFSQLPIEIHTLIHTHQLIDFYFQSDVAEDDNDLIWLFKYSLKNKKHEEIEIDRVFFVSVKSADWDKIDCDFWIEQIDSVVEDLFKD